MADLGSMCVWIALALASYGAVGSVVGKLRGSPELVASSQRAVPLTVLALTVATLSLVTLFINRDFEVAYVAAHSDLAMEDHFTWVAFYAGNEGSLLYIAFVLSIMSAIAVWRASGGGSGHPPLHHGRADVGVDLLRCRHRVHGQPLRQTSLRAPGWRRDKPSTDPLRHVLSPSRVDGWIDRRVHTIRVCLGVLTGWQDRRRVGGRRPGLGTILLGAPGGAGCCWAPGGPTRFWDGAGIGSGTRWRTRP